MVHLMKAGLFVCIAMGFGGCTNGPSDPIVREGYEALDAAYVLKIKPADASYTKCAYREITGRHVVRCGISYGDTKLAQVGYWEIVSVSGKYEVYAMNGKALATLDRLAGIDAFKAGSGQRTPLDLVVADAEFSK